MAAWLSLRQGVPFLPAVLAAVAATALMGAILAYPTVRVRGVYLAVITIAFGLVFENILKEWLSVTGGTQGLIGIPRGNVFGFSLTRPIYFWVVAGCLSSRSSSSTTSSTRVTAAPCARRRRARMPRVRLA